MNILSAISIIASIVYLYIGFSVSSLDSKKINRLFLVFCIAMAIWSFAYAFYYLQNEDQYIWIKVSAIGWCTFSSFLLHMVIIITENKLNKNLLAQISLYVPSVLFFYISVFLFGENQLPSKFVQDFFYIGDFIYHSIFLLTSIILIGIWGYNSNSIRIRMQSKIILITSITPFVLNLLTQTILPAIGKEGLPLMGHLYSLIMIFGVYYVIKKYRLLAINSELLVHELLHEMLDLVVIVSPKGNIIKINNSTEKLLGYQKSELYDKHLRHLISEEVVEKILNFKHSNGIFRLEGVDFIKKNGSKVPVNMSCSFIIDPIIKDVVGTVIVGQDITLLKKLEDKIAEHKKAQEYISYIANHDSLTGLPNRKQFHQTLESTIDALKNTDKKFAVFFLDLDYLKVINDNYGHEAGDYLLCEVGKRAENSIDNNDVVARIGGDEFTFIILGITSREKALKKANHVLENINKPINLADKYFNVSSSIGVSIFPEDGLEAQTLINKADREMYLTKKGKKAVEYFKKPGEQNFIFNDNILKNRI